MPVVCTAVKNQPSKRASRLATAPQPRSWSSARVTARSMPADRADHWRFPDVAVGVRLFAASRQGTPTTALYGRRPADRPLRAGVAARLLRHRAGVRAGPGLPERTGRRLLGYDHEPDDVLLRLLRELTGTGQPGRVYVRPGDPRLARREPR